MQTLRQDPRAVSQLLRLAAATVALAAAPVFAQQSDSGASTPGAGPDTTSALVQLQLDPLSIAPPTHPPQGRKVNFDSNTVKSYRAQLSAQRNDYKQWLQANVPQAKITGQFDI